MLVLVVYC